MGKNFDIFLNDFSDEEQELEIFREYAIDFKTGEYLRGDQLWKVKNFLKKFK